MKDGGPAFPHPNLFYGDPGRPETKKAAYPGMTLRDYFAGQIIMGLVSNAERLDLRIVEGAAKAYEIADAMLAVRERQP